MIMEEGAKCVKNPGEMNIEISRGPTPEIGISDIQIVEDCIVYDGEGNSRTIKQLCASKKTIIIFVRHFLCYACVEYVEDIENHLPHILDNLQEAGVQLLIIGCAPWRFIKKFSQKVKCPHKIYCDPELKIHSLLKLKGEKYFGSPKESKHIKSGLMTGLIKSTWNAWESMEWQGDPKQQGGAMVIGENGRVLFSHVDERATNHCSINTLLSAAGMDKLSFPKDPQVFTI